MHHALGVERPWIRFIIGTGSVQRFNLPETSFLSQLFAHSLILTSALWKEGGFSCQISCGLFVNVFVRHQIYRLGFSLVTSMQIAFIFSRMVVA